MSIGVTSAPVGHRRKGYNIAAGTELDLVSIAQNDSVVGDYGGVQTQAQGGKSLRATVRTVIVDCVEIVRLTGLFARAFQMGLTNHLKFRAVFSPLFSFF